MILIHGDLHYESVVNRDKLLPYEHTRQLFPDDDDVQCYSPLFTWDELPDPVKAAIRLCRYQE